MCTYLYLYLYRYLYLYLYDDETYLRPTGNSLIYSGRGFRRRHKTWSVVPKSWTSDSSENGEGLDGLDPSLFHRPFGAESWGPMGNQWEINGKSMGNQWEITLEVSKMIRRTMKSHSHYSLGRSPMEKPPTVAGSTEFLGSEVRCLPARRSGVAMASHGGS